MLRRIGGVLVDWVVGCVMGWVVERACDKVVGVGLLGVLERYRVYKMKEP